MTDGESLDERRGPDRPMRRTHGLGIFCAVCICHGESRDVYELDDRESLVDHWTEEHDW